MPYFRWTGITLIGTIVKGKGAAHSPDDLSEHLFRRGIALLRCSSLFILPFMWRMTSKTKEQTFASMARLFSAGIIIPDIFVIVMQQTDNPLLYDALYTWMTDIKNGVPFASSVKNQHQLCDTFVSTILIVGHESGFLAQAVDHVAAYYYTKNSWEKNVRAALAMPLLTLSFFMGISLFIFLFIMPRFADMFTSMNVELPLLTHYMMKISCFMSSASILYVVLLMIVGFMLICHVMKQSKKQLWYRIIMKVPFIGTCVHYHELEQFFYALFLLLESNISLLQAVSVLESSTRNHGMKKVMCALKQEIESGTLLSVAMSGTLIFPADIVALIRIGEEAGSLEKSLLSASERCKMVTQTTLKQLLFCLQPLLIVVLGFLIGTLILAVYLPIMNFSYSI